MRLQAAGTLPSSAIAVLNTKNSRASLFFSGLSLEVGVHVVGGPARTQAQRSMTAARSTGHCSNLSQKHSGVGLNGDLYAFGGARAANELQQSEVKG